MENGALELTNNSAERPMKPVAIGRKNLIFAGSEGGGKIMVIADTLIVIDTNNDKKQNLSFVTNCTN